VIQHSYDGYTTNVPLEAFAGENVLLASRWEGKPISREHGGPVRLVLPKLYFWRAPSGSASSNSAPTTSPASGKSAATTITGDPWTEQRYS